MVHLTSLQFSNLECGGSQIPTILIFGPEIHWRTINSSLHIWLHLTTTQIFLILINLKKNKPWSLLKCANVLMLTHLMLTFGSFYLSTSISFRWSDFSHQPHLIQRLNICNFCFKFAADMTCYFTAHHLFLHFKLFWPKLEMKKEWESMPTLQRGPRLQDCKVLLTLTE